MKKQTNKILILNILNVIFTILFSLLIIATILAVCISLKQTFVAILVILPIVSFISIIIFYLISYRKRKIGITNLLFFMCSLNIFSLLISYKIISELESLDILQNEDNEKVFEEKNILMASWEIELEKAKIDKKLAKLSSTNENKKVSKKNIEQKLEVNKREVYKSYTKFVYKNILKKNPEEKNTFKIITLTSNAIVKYEYLDQFLKQEKLIKDLEKFGWTKEEVVQVITTNDIEQIITTFKENRKDY
ncbi:hypothetical protein [Mesoplasma coleopterae]|uniref:Uncharacterized protein n=1 Tax=Mesoplasma coleopterae TaxID=324078 RepID=A0A2K8P1X1_9MOLU|nr:hypothetical protein [Mesoplasma coleopterae]ATZ20757.1 hypothetical protein MCOLE_v1c02430 [Mesoplasma coleopterae]AVN62265.1 hypothetical protein CG001_01210 [Mesoplasma coleopterae]AVN62933.1 hypothetical protein CG000_01280 [Mesoplasma coleopterae]